jgi:hypothetical protein
MEPRNSWLTSLVASVLEPSLVPPRNRLSPRYINIAHDQDNRIHGWGKQHKHAQKKTQKKERESNAEKVGSTKTEMPRNRCARRRISTTFLALGSPAYQATPSRRDATMTPLLPGVILGFPPVRARTGRQGFTQRPSRRKGGARGRHRVGVGETDRDFSRPS